MASREVTLAGGESTSVSFSVTNVGEVTGSHTVVLKINGEEATREVTLNSGARQEVSFSIVRTEAGTYTVDVNGLTDSFVVKEKPVPAPILAKPFNWWIIVIVAGVVITVKFPFG